MNKLQAALILLALSYLFVKGVIFLVLYRQTYVVERKARSKQMALHTLLARKRAQEKQKYSKAYELSGVVHRGEIEGI